MAGFRHEAELEAGKLSEGDAVHFVPEPHNLVETQAIRMETAGKKLGYVPRGHLDTLHRMLGRGAHLEGEVFRINGSPERPLVYVLTRITRDDKPTMLAHALRMQA